MVNKICRNCKKIITDPKQKYYCDVDCRLAYTNKKGGRAKMSAQKMKLEDIENPEKYYDCICPICGKLHRYKMFWSGANITPRINCMKCKQTIRQKSFNEETVRML